MQSTKKKKEKKKKKNAVYGKPAEHVQVNITRHVAIQNTLQPGGIVQKMKMCD